MSSRHTRKKRRLNPEEGSSTELPTEVIPLVMPNLVRKSSKDPNRGMYPTKRLSRKLNSNVNSPSTSASTVSTEEIETSHYKNQKIMHEDSESEHSEAIKKLIMPKRTKKSCARTRGRSETSASVSNSSVQECCYTKLRRSCASTTETNRLPTSVSSNTDFIKASDLVESSSRVGGTSPLVSSDSDVDQCMPKKRKSLAFMSSKTIRIRNKRITKSVIVSGPQNSIKNYFKKLTEKTKCSVNDFNQEMSDEAEENYYVKLSEETKGSVNTFNKEILDEASCSDTCKNKTVSFFEKFDKCYGLLGESLSTEYNDNRPNYFEKLPDHIMETIFCQIPILDLLNCRLVCKVWNNVISSGNFMDWKMLYYRVKKEDKSALLKLEKIMTDLDLKTAEDTFKVLIRFMAKDYKRKPSDDMYQVLIKNELALTAEEVLNERFPDICTSDSKPWVIFTIAILLSSTVWDIYDLYNTLMSTKSHCSLHDVTNALYCIATFLLHFRNAYSINYGLPYRVYYVLYMIENTLPSKKVPGAQSLLIPKGLPGQQSLHSYGDTRRSVLTYEQIRILNHRFQPKQRIKIIALAGTGKTTTLIHLARLYPQVRFLNIVYNSSMCVEAKKRFPRNVECRTMHSLAYTVEGARLRYKLARKLRPHDIVNVLKHKGGSSLHTYSYAKHVLSTVSHYLCSREYDLSINNVPLQESNSRDLLSQEDRVRILKDAKILWEKMTDREEKSIKITHDVYLKLYQRSKPDLSEFQCIMVDEVQDCNPAMIDVVLSQDMPVILVGDPNQQIYGFRGAENVLQNIDATHTYHLTKSFRFGPEIAYFSSCCLESLKGIKTQTLVGTEKASYINGKSHGQYAIISRTNVTLFNEAIRLCCLNTFREHEPTTINGAVVGGLESLGLQQMLDLCKLAGCLHCKPDYVIKDKFISKFKSYEDVTTYAKNADDLDLLTKIELIKRYDGQLPDFIETLKEKCRFPLHSANVVFSTAHKAKGLEFDTVCLTDDYPLTKYSNFGRRSSLDFPRGIQPSSEEFNVFYVAATRAKTCLIFPEKMYSTLITAASEKFEYPVSTKSIAGNDEEFMCVKCNETFKPHTVLTSVRKETTLSNGRKISSGALCMKCRTNPTVRMRVELEPVIMYSDPINDGAHLSMSSLVGPLPNDGPIVHGHHAAFQEMDIVYIINVRL